MLLKTHKYTSKCSQGGSWMRIAFLLTLYSEPEQANLFIKQLLNYEGSNVFIHLDSKADNIRKQIIHHDRVKIMDNSIEVNWGDFSQIQSIIELMKFAKASGGHFDYYSLHSGSDLLVRSIEELVHFLKSENKYAFTDCKPLPRKDWQYGSGLGRISLHWPMILRKKYSHQSPMRYLRSLYGKLYGAKLIKGKALPSHITFYGGSDWFTIRYDCLDDILDYTANHPEFMNLFEHSLIGSEIYFVTLFNIRGRAEEMVSNNNLRYIDFNNTDKKSPGSPKVLTLDDRQRISKSRHFFARKFDSKVDQKVIETYLSEEYK
jgi:hypothetical protein